jgi:type I restriction enzyme M protein
MSNNDIVQKLWNLCDVLRDDGINYSDYVTELVLLLFIKMEHENAQSGVLGKHKLPDYARWPVHRRSRPEPAQPLPRNAAQAQQSTDPLIAAIYADAQTSLKEPRHLEQLIKAWTASTGSAPSATAWAISTKACSRRTPAKPRAAPGNTSPRAR